MPSGWESYVAVSTGSDPKKIVVNGANKPAELLEAAILSDVIVNVDSLDELAEVADRDLGGSHVERLGNPHSVPRQLDHAARRSAFVPLASFSLENLEVLLHLFLGASHHELAGRYEHHLHAD